MAKIIIAGSDPLISSVMAYLSIDGDKEVKVQYNKGKPHYFDIPTGTHHVSVNTRSKARRVLREINNDGSFLGSMSTALNDAQNDSWEGTVTLPNESSVFLAYVETKVASTVIHAFAIDESELDTYFQHFDISPDGEITVENQTGGKKGVELVLCLFLGIFGAHKFYQGKPGMGVLYLLTGGLCGIGVLVDFFRILFRK